MSTKVINSIKSEICSILGLTSIDAKVAKTLQQATGLSDFKSPETWQQLLNNIKAKLPLESSTTDDNTSEDESITEDIKPVAMSPMPLKLNLGGGLGLGIVSQLPVEDTEVKAINLKERSKRAVMYSGIVDSGYRAIVLYLHLPSIKYILSGVYVAFQDTQKLIANKVQEIKEKSLTALEQYELYLKASQNKSATRAIVFYYHIGTLLNVYVITVENGINYYQVEERVKVLTAKETQLKEKEKKQIASLHKQSNVDARLTTTISSEVSKVNFKQIAVRRQRRILEDSGMAFNINTDLRQTFKALWKLLEKIEISDEINNRLLIQQNEDSYNNHIYKYIYANLNNKVKQQFATKFSFSAPLNVIASHQENVGGITNLSKQKPTFNLTRQLEDEFSKYLSTIEYIESKNKDSRTESESELLEVHESAKESALNHLRSKYTIDIQQLTLKNWLSICLDNLGIVADKEKGKGRIDVYADTIEQLEIKRNPLAVISHLLYENIYNSNDVVTIGEFNPDSLAVIDRYAVTRTIAEFKNQYSNYLLAELSHNYGNLHSSIPIEHKHKVWFNKKLLANRKLVKDWIANNSTYKPQQLKSDFRELYSLINKVSDYKPSNLNIADEVLKQSYRPVRTLEVMALPVSLTSHFEGKEQLGDKYRKSPVAQGKMRTSAINDRSLNNLLPDVPLYCRQKLGDIIVLLKASPVENRFIDIVWCDKSQLDKGGKELVFNPIGSITSKNIQGKHVAICKLVPKFVTLASKHQVGNGTTSLYFVLAALDNWGLKDNHPVSYNPNRYLELEEVKKAEEILATTDNEQFEKYLAQRYEIGKNRKFIPIWSELIGNHFSLKFTPVEVDMHTYIEVTDNREIRQINNFKSAYPNSKQSSNNSVSRLTYQVASKSRLDRVDNKEEIVTRKQQITAKEYYALLLKEGLNESDEVTLKDGRILRRVKNVNTYTNRITEHVVTGLDHKNRPIVEKRVIEEKREKVDAGYNYFVVNERRVDTWHY